MKVWPLTPRGTGAVILGIASFVLAHTFGVGALLYFSVLLLAVVAVSVATLYLVRRTEQVTRSFLPDTAAAGGEVDVRARVSVRSPLPTTQGRWKDRLPAGITGDATGTFPAMASGLAAGARVVDIAYRVRTERRGVRSIGPLEVTSTDPFGFARRRHLIGRAVPLTVAPAIVELGALSELPGAAGGSMHSTTNELGQGSDNLIPRVYVPGDSMRRIHWRASAHRDELMVRQEEQESTPEAIVVLDRSVHRWSSDALRAPGLDSAFETAVSACASTIAKLVHEGYTVTAIDVDGTGLVERIDAGDSFAVEAMTAAFATLTARRDAGLDELVRLFAGTMTGPLVLITGTFTPEDAAALAPLAHHSTLPLLLAVGADQDALAHAAAHGWHAASVHPEDDLADVWADVNDRGQSRVGA